MRMFRLILVLFVVFTFHLLPVGSATGNTGSGQDAVLKTSTPAVELFVTSWCPYCKRAESFFRREGVKFNKFDVEKDPKARARFQKLNPSGGVPVALINGRKIKGYSEDAYLRALGGD